MNDMSAIQEVLSFDRALLSDGSVRAVNIGLDDGIIANLTVGAEAAPRGLVALPGIVDLHGDAIEHPLMPRPGVDMPVEVALCDTDRRLAANGITTALHGLTCSWEPGLRSAETVDAVLDALERLAPTLWVDHRVHLRFESHALDAVEDARRWLAGGAVDLVSVNRHFPGVLAQCDEPGHLAPLAKRAGLDIDGYRALLLALAEREPEVEPAVAAVFAAAAKHGVAGASHDDRTAEERAANRARGATIVDFPTTAAAARAAAEAGEAVIMGAPNVLRGGSHMKGKGISATDLVLAGDCGILASDYFYPALPAAAIKLWREHGMAFGRAWDLVSANPARAVGLHDRGVLAVGRRADIVLLDLGAAAGATPRVAGLWVAGSPIFMPPAMTAAAGAPHRQVA